MRLCITQHPQNVRIELSRRILAPMPRYSLPPLAPVLDLLVRRHCLILRTPVAHLAAVPVFLGRAHDVTAIAAAAHCGTCPLPVDFIGPPERTTP